MSPTKRSSPSPSRCSASKPWVPTSSSASNRTWAGSRTITAASQLDPLVGSIISASEKVNYAKGITNDWQDYVFRTVFTMDHQLSFQGGNEKTTYMASVSYLDNPGVVYNSNYQRTNVYASINQKMNDWLSVGLTTQFVNRETGGATPNLEHAIKQSPYGIYKDETGAYYEEPMDYSNLPNPMKDVNADQKRTGRNFMANGFLGSQTSGQRALFPVAVRLQLPQPDERNLLRPQHRNG